MIKIGLTGNIGTGKTTVAKIFSTLEVPIFYSDIEAKKILYNSDIKKQLVSIFTEVILDKNQEIDKKILAKIVFNDKEALSKLNNIIHPKVKDIFNEWVLIQNSNYVIMEAAILFEANFNDMFDKIILVTAPEKTILNRVAKRDNISEDKVLERLQNQWSQESKEKLSDFIIRNDNVEPLLPQVLKIHDTILSLTNKLFYLR